MATLLMKHRFLSCLLFISISLQMTACTIEEENTATTSTNTGTTLGTIDLAWIAPSIREDNTPLSLSEIAGYRLYYGTSQGDYIYEVNIDDSSAESYTFTNLQKGTYYIVATTYDTEGRESQYSSEIMITI